MKNVIKIFFIGVVLSILNVQAETIKSEDYTFNLKATRDGSEYKQGEEVEFLLKATKNGQPVEVQLSGKFTKDSVDLGQNFSGSTKDGKFSVKSSLNEAGFLRCEMYVKFPAKDGKTKGVFMLANAGIDVLKIKPSLPAPKDFNKFWAEQNSAD